jgi:hypothetical protein
MKRKRDLLITNLLSLLVLLAALMAGWRDAAAFGLAVLLVMDLLVVLGERWPRRSFRSQGSADASAEQGQVPPPEASPDSEHTEPDVEK